MKKQNAGKGTGGRMSRREFIKVSAAGAAATALIVTGWPGSIRRAVAGRDHILVGFCNPSTGPLAAFGESSPFVDNRSLAEINKTGGIYIKDQGRKMPVRLKMLDAESDPTKAAELAARLILNEQVDLMLALHAPNMVNPVSAVCERFETPCIALDCPLEPWLEGGPYKWTHHAFWSLKDDLLPVCDGLWSQMKTNKVVGLIANNDPDGIAFTGAFKQMLPARGYSIVDPGTFPYGTQDFTSLISTWKKSDVQILFGNVITPDFVNCWRQCRQMGFVPRIAFISRAVLFPSAVEALGDDLAQGLSSELWWSPRHPFKSSLTGESAGQLCEAYTRETGKQWTQPIGFQHAAYEILADALKRAASLDKELIRKAVAATNLDTIVGHIQYNRQNFSRTPLVGGQWVHGERFPWKLNVVYNRQHPEIGLTGAFVPVGGAAQG
jgi:branched-chain amino acid transport system substrate-binding protein